MITPAIPWKPSLPLVFAALLAAGCAAGPTFAPSDAATVLDTHLMSAPDPSHPGPHPVKTLYYGSGTDKRRAVYRDSVTIRTDPVDASRLVDLGDSEASRKKFWGFSTHAYPVNGRVWYPEGDGPFPLVLMVHGNHNMKEFSDPGYGYLGQLLASRGFVFVSVDMNFLNGSIRNENDARGWMLLKHLEAWRAISAGDGPLPYLVDLDNVALMGHSRGGEAVAHAAAFNRLARYPEDGSLAFDFGFGIRSIIAVAPVDGQYLPTGRHVPLEDVNYMVFHGSHDGDVTSFHGLRQYHRLTFSGDGDYFKTAIYVYRANHGQWNTVWNNKDRGPRSGRSLRLADLIPAAEQRQFAEVYITAFLEATLRGQRSYLPLFRDHRLAADWLPPTMYVTRYQHSSLINLANFEEDIDLTSGSLGQTRIESDSLSQWKEESLELRSSNRATTLAIQQNQVVRVGWERDSTRTAPEYRILLDRPLALDSTWTLEFALAPTPLSKEDSLSSPGRVLDLSVTLEDSLGYRSGVSLGDYGAIRLPLPIQILRRNMDKERFAATSEVVLQTYSIPLADLGAALDLSAITALRFQFDRSPKGDILLDDVGFAQPGEDFLQPRRILRPVTANESQSDGLQPDPATRTPRSDGRR